MSPLMVPTGRGGALGEARAGHAAPLSQTRPRNHARCGAFLLSTAGLDAASRTGRVPGNWEAPFLNETTATDGPAFLCAIYYFEASNKAARESTTRLDDLNRRCRRSNKRKVMAEGRAGTDSANDLQTGGRRRRDMAAPRHRRLQQRPQRGPHLRFMSTSAGSGA